MRPGESSRHQGGAARTGGDVVGDDECDDEDEDRRVERRVARVHVVGVGVERVEAEHGADHRRAPRHEQPKQLLDRLVDGDLRRVRAAKDEGLLARAAERVALDGDEDVAVCPGVAGARDRA